MTVPPTGRRLLVVILLGAADAAGTAWIGAPRPTPLDAASLAHVSGMLAGYLSVVMLVLMSRIPFLENRVGADVVAQWHSLGGRLFLAFTLIHIGAATQAWAQSRQQSVPAAVGSLLALPQLWPAAAATALFVMIAAVSIRSARRRVAYETWHVVHLLTYVAVCLAFLHELAGPNLAGHRAVQVAWTLMHVYALTLVVRYRVIAPLEAAWRHRLTVAAVIPEADGVASVIIHGRHLHELAPNRDSSCVGVSSPAACGGPGIRSRCPLPGTATSCGSPSRRSGTAAAASIPSAPVPESSPRDRQGR